MLRIYDGEVFVIELENFKESAGQILDNIAQNPDYDKMVFLLEKAGKIIAATNLMNLLRNYVVNKTFSDRGGFLEVKTYCMENSVPYDTFFPVLNSEGECVYLFHYVEDIIYTKFGRHVYGSSLNYQLDANIEELDYSLASEADTYIFSEIEEYTYAATILLKRKYPHKSIYFLDKKITYFPELQDKVMYIEGNITCKNFGKERCQWIISDGRVFESMPVEYYKNSAERGKPDFFGENWKQIPTERFTNIYNSVNLLYSMCWCLTKESFGMENKDCHIFLADFQGHDSGLGDYIYFICLWRMVAKRRGWKFAVNLCYRPNQYLMAEGENMWDYFFESVSDVQLEEVYRSASVIRASVNKINFCEWRLPYQRHETYNDQEIMPMIKFNIDTKNRIDELMPKMLKEDNRVLGVILRGTDYRPEAHAIENRPKRTADLEKMIKKCRFIMKLYGYETLFLATEDLEYFERMRKEFGENCLFIDQKRVYHDYRVSHKSCANLLEIQNGKEFGRKYLAVVQSLANCRALLSNTLNNTTWMAKMLNNFQYEYYEVVEP